MIRIVIAPRLRKSLDKLPAEVRLKGQTKLAEVAAAFGNPHQHSGLGLRKLGKCSYEIRVHLKWRIILIHEGDSLIAFDVMDHNQVTAWLRGR